MPPAENKCGFLKLRRGLDEHLARMTSDAVKLYLRLLFLADWRNGKSQGLAQATFSEIAVEFSWSPRQVRRVTAELRKSGYIVVERRGNQRVPSIVRITKYDGASATDCLSSSSADAANGLSTDEHRPESRGVAATGGLSVGLCTPASPNEIKRPAPAKKYKERRSSSKNGAPEKKMFDLDDRPFELTGRVWQKLGIARLSGTFQAFVDLVNRMQPGIEETVATWCSKILDACEAEHITYPRAFLRVTREFREKRSSLCFYSLTEQIAEENRRRSQL